MAEDKSMKELSSSQESLPLSQETFKDLWNLVDMQSTDEMMKQITEDYKNLPPLIPASAPAQEPPPTYPVRSSLPATSCWPGDFGFHVSFAAQEKNTKHINWTYSEKDKKLYVKKDSPCPFNISTNSAMMGGVLVRAMACYTSPEHASEIVTRCVNHSQGEILQNIFEAEHIIRCESSSAVYQVDPVSRRHSVVVPFENPGIGQWFSTYIFKFACFSSCSGGPNRRPLTLVFTLEKENMVLGRVSMDLKICACPGRDREIAEKLIPSPPVGNQIKRQKTAEENPVSKFFEKSLAHKKKKKKPGEKKEYIIKVDDEECYNFLWNMKRLFTMYKTVNNIPQEFKASICLVKSSSDEEERP